MKLKVVCLIMASTAVISACANFSPASLTIKKVGPTYVPPEPAAKLAPTWSAPLPHAGDTALLSAWWSRWNDPALLGLIAAAQTENPTLDAALARIAGARAAAVMAGSSTLPDVSGSAGLTRGNQGQGAATSLAASAQASWEIDLFGGQARGREAAAARLQARSVEWHDARVSVAAEVASIYVDIRANEALLDGFQGDEASRAETARLLQLKATAGFEAPANVQLSSAGAADARVRAASSTADIARGIQNLATLTGLSAPDVRQRISAVGAPPPPGFVVEAVPATALAQRPDLAGIERALAAASAEIGVAEADRYPRVSLLGNLGLSATRIMGGTNDGVTWGFGPSISLPVFDQNRRAANVEAARARYDEIAASYRAAARKAAGEVELALLHLQSVSARVPHVAASVAGFSAFEKAAQARLSAGVGSVLELEEARRTVLAARVAQVSLTREQQLAWISLYRAIGGGWDAAQLAIPTSNTHSTQATLLKESK